MKSNTSLLALFTLVVTTAAALAAEIGDGVPPEDDFAPGLFIGVVIIGTAFLVLVGIGIVIALICASCAAVLATLGIISSSTIVAILRRRFSSGIRALHYQVFSLIALPCGVGALWLISILFELHLRHRYILLIGSGVGLTAGVALAFLLDWCFRHLYRRAVTLPQQSLPT